MTSSKNNSLKNKPSENNPEEILNFEDFRSAQLEAFLKNLSVAKNAHQQPLPCPLVEINDHQLKLEVPSAFCKKGQELLVTVIREEKGQKQSFEGKSLVKDIDPFQTIHYQKNKAIQVEDNPIDNIVVEFSDPAVLQAWQTFYAIFAQKQNEIETYFRSMKD